MSFRSFYQGKRVLLTGDTGFKGAWLGSWLDMLGAEVHGIGLPPETQPNLFEHLGLKDRLRHTDLDIRDAEALRKHVLTIRPQVVFHLAAQALVRRSYSIPLDTLHTNYIGTANLLDAVGHTGYRPDDHCVIVAVTTDKVYENRETDHAYTEDDRIGGHDPYSASKGATEILLASWRRSFFTADHGTAPSIRLVCARAGNVIGGGDWAEDRIVVDSIRALTASRPIGVRNPLSVRPWQHVLDPLSGYLRVAEVASSNCDPTLDSAYNFGPGANSERTVGELCDAIVRHWGRGSWQQTTEQQAVHEARFLRLSVDKAERELDWRPTWDFEQTVENTVRWYRHAYESELDPATISALTSSQIEDYMRDTETLIPGRIEG